MDKRWSIPLQNQHIPHFKTLNKDEQLDLENHRKVLKVQRESFTHELVANLKKVDTDVQELKEAISLDIQNIGLHYFKDVMKAISDFLDRNENTLNFKHKELLEKEKLLFQELKQIDQEVFDLSIGRSFWTKLDSKPLETYHINLPKSIRLFDEFLLKCGGHSGGWKPEDHQLFLHLKNKYPPEQIAEILHHKLPDISIEQVLQHVAWHEKYTSLLEDKKQTVEKWKSSKMTGRSQSVENMEKTVKADTPSSNPSTGRKTFRKSNEEVKKEIAAWKLAKSARLKEEQELKIQEKEKKLAVKRERKEIEMIEKQKMTHYLTSKLKTQLQQKEEYETMREEEKKNRARKANIMVQVFRRQDEKRQQDKLERKRQLALARMATEKRLSRVKCEVNVSRDPQRVQKPTTGWKNRVAREVVEKIESTCGVDYIAHVPHLKVPAWRQDVKFQDQIIL